MRKPRKNSARIGDPYSRSVDWDMDEPATDESWFALIEARPLLTACLLALGFRVLTCCDARHWYKHMKDMTKMQARFVFNILASLAGKYQINGYVRRIEVYGRKCEYSARADGESSIVPWIARPIVHEKLLPEYAATAGNSAACDITNFAAEKLNEVIRVLMENSPAVDVQEILHGLRNGRVTIRTAGRPSLEIPLR